MLVKFSSVKTDSLIMHGEAAVALIRIMGATGNVPGALSATDLPAALQRLQSELPTPQPTTATDDAQDQPERESVELHTRAIPLIALVQRAIAGQATLMWESM